jgi:hypothetical protein
VNITLPLTLLPSPLLLKRMKHHFPFLIEQKAYPTLLIRRAYLLPMSWWFEGSCPLRKSRRGIHVSPLWVNALVVVVIERLILILILMC